MSESNQVYKPLISVIIPTYNRRDSLLRSLESLSHQSISPDEYEVIVVEDGSLKASLDLQTAMYPFALQCVTQKNQGATVSRNNGALISKGELLVFIDDDITVSSFALQALAKVCLNEVKAIALGVPKPRNIDPGCTFARIAVSAEASDIVKHTTLSGITRLEECNTQILAVRRTDFLNIGMFQDPTGGWPNWDDVDFGYRATQAGYRIIRVDEAPCAHWDQSLCSLQSATQRWYRASKSAVKLFQKYPELIERITMFADMIPIDWHHDPPQIILRKLFRRISSYEVILVCQSKLINVLEKVYPSEPVMKRLYQLITGGYKYKGFRQGIKQYGPLSEKMINMHSRNVNEDLSN